MTHVKPGLGQGVQVSDFVKGLNVLLLLYVSLSELRHHLSLELTGIAEISGKRSIFLKIKNPGGFPGFYIPLVFTVCIGLSYFSPSLMRPSLIILPAILSAFIL